MYSDVLVVFSSLIGVVGTVYSVLSILKLSIKDLLSTITYEGVATRDQEVLVQREQARIGIPLVIIGWIFQSIFSLIKVKTAEFFLFLLVLMIVVVIIEVVITNKMNKKFKKKYGIERSKPIETHQQKHEWEDM